MIFVLAYIADAVIIATYLYLAHTGKVRPFHWANAFGAIPIVATEIALAAWPVLILTAFFGIGAAYGLLKGDR